MSAAPTIYSAPAKVAMFDHAGTLRGHGLQADGDGGAVNIAINNKVTPRFSALGGYMGSTIDDIMGKVSLTPFDSWALLPLLFPFKCVKTGGTTAGKLGIGDRPHDAAAAGLAAAPNTGAGQMGATKIWTPDNGLYTFVRSAITKHPNMNLSVGKPLFTGIEITALADITKGLGDDSALMLPPVEPSGTGNDPDSAVPVNDFLNERWTGSWAGSATGLGAGDIVLDATEGFELMCDAKYGAVIGSKRTWHMHLLSVQFAIKGKLFGPTHTNLMGELLKRKLGSRAGASTDAAGAALTMSSSSGKTIVLASACPIFENAGFTFGGNAMAAGEVVFVSNITYTTPGTQDTVLTFS